jgi:maltooligosyltrehalose synthase
MKSRLFLALIAFGLIGTAQADPIEHCGQEPAPPTVSGSDAAHYNASVDRFQAYEKEARAYNACVSAQATKEETAISEDARVRIAKIHAESVTVQQRIAANFAKLSAALTAASKKLGKH